MKDRTDLTYRMMQGCFWMLYCCFYGYITYFLLQKGFETVVIGVISAGFGIVSAVLQPILGRIADRTKLGWKLPLVTLISLVAITSVLLILVNNETVSGYLFGVGVMLMGSMMPLLNAASFHCKRAGHNVDFGKARGTGSFTYAVLSVILGKLTVLYGEWVIPIAALIVAVIFVIISLRLPQYSQNNIKLEDSGETGKKLSQGFIKKYPAFMLMFIAGVCFMTFHNMTNTYMIQMFEPVGGNSNSLGIAHAIAAISELPIMFGYIWINKRIKSKTLLVFAGLGFIIKASLYVIAGSVGTIYAAQVCQIISFALFGSASVYYAEEVCLPEDKTTGQAFMSSTLTIGYVLGSLVGGSLIDGIGLHGMLVVGVAQVAAGALLAGAGFILDKKQRVRN